MESLAGKEFHHEDVVEDHWMNATNDYDVCIRDYCRMTLYLVEKALKIKIPLKIVQQDTDDLLNLFFNKKRLATSLL